MQTIFRRQLTKNFTGELPQGAANPEVFLPGTLVIEGESFDQDQDLPQRLAGCKSLKEWPVVVLVDNTREACVSLKEFLWSFFTRFEPAADIHGAQTTVQRFHVGLEAPVVFDCRMKPWYPPVLEVDPETKEKVDKKIHNILPAKWC